LAFVYSSDVGFCLDTITAQPSTIPEAGQGAFANRKFPTGSIVSVSPMVTISNGPAAMEVPLTKSSNTPPRPDDNVGDDEDRYVPDTRDSNATQQLLTNYCFGHAKSDLMLCPTTQAALMNHADASSSSVASSSKGKVPNVAVRWSSINTDEDPHYDFTLEPLESIIHINHTDLSSFKTRVIMEYVAIRPIEPGEELLLDYTREWNDALTSHLEHGHSSSANADPDRLSAQQVNEMGRAIAPSVDVRSQHLAYLCEIYPNVKVLSGSTAGWEDLSSNSAIDRKTWPTVFRQWYKHNDAASIYPCNVVKVDEARNMYDVEMLLKPLLLGEVGRKFRDVPGHRIQYTDPLYHSDMHLEWAFRQHIPVPDSIFPLRWRRDYKSAQNMKLGSFANEDYSKAQEESYEQSLRKVKCGLYLAKSNIPNAGFGLYTAVDIPAGGIMVATSQMAIPTFEAGTGQPWPGKDYIWGGSPFGTSATEASSAPSFLSVLFGALANAHTGIHNVNHDFGKWSPVLDATQDYGAGAFSDYIEDGHRSRYAIGAGEELFASYGKSFQ
jgi:hypothetical protein